MGAAAILAATSLYAGAPETPALPSTSMSPADAIVLAFHARLTGAARLEIAADMSTAARELALAGLRQRHPDWPEERLRRELAQHTLLTQTAPAPAPQSRP